MKVNVMNENERAKCLKIEGFDSKDFEKWCKENGKNPEKKTSMLQYGATKSDVIKEIWDKYLDGEVDLSQIELISNVKFTRGIKKHMKEVVEEIMVALSKFIEGEENEEISEKFGKLKGIYSEAFCEAFYLNVGDTLAEIYNASLKALEYSVEKQEEIEEE